MPDSEKVSIFISHGSNDKDLALALKRMLDQSFTGAIDTFVSSSDLLPGEDWYSVIRARVQNANFVLVLLTPFSYQKSWVIFEAGAAVGRGLNPIPICAKGLDIFKVIEPLNTYQVISLQDEEQVNLLVRKIELEFKLVSSINAEHIDKVLELSKPLLEQMPGPLPPAVKDREYFEVEELKREWAELAEDRKVFWDALRECFPVFRSESEILNDQITFEGLVDLADPPVGLPLQRGENLRDYSSSFAPQLKKFDRVLLDFCVGVYGPRSGEKNSLRCR